MQWYREMNKTERRTFIGAFGGWAIDALDFMVFTFVISTLISLWGIEKGQAGMLGTVTLLFSAIGGWLAGILADRYGRVRILQITILWFSACTVAIGFAQNFEQLLILRALQGLGFEVVANTPQQFTAFQQAEVKRWKDVIKQANIQLE